MRRLGTDGHCGRWDSPSAGNNVLYSKWANVMVFSKPFRDYPDCHACFIVNGHRHGLNSSVPIIIHRKRL
jgi:hypothetical protein